jgi:hypothetical protein
VRRVHPAQPVAGQALVDDRQQLATEVDRGADLEAQPVAGRRRPDREQRAAEREGDHDLGDRVLHQVDEHQRLLGLEDVVVGPAGLSPHGPAARRRPVPIHRAARAVPAVAPLQPTPPVAGGVDRQLAAAEAVEPGHPKVARVVVQERAVAVERGGRRVAVAGDDRGRDRPDRPRRGVVAELLDDRVLELALAPVEIQADGEPLVSRAGGRVGLHLAHRNMGVEVRVAVLTGHRDGEPPLCVGPGQPQRQQAAVRLAPLAVPRDHEMSRSG